VLIGLALFALCTLWIIERQFLPPTAVRRVPCISSPKSSPPKPFFFAER
jgi:hypothetical protein